MRLITQLSSLADARQTGSAHRAYFPQKPSPSLSSSLSSRSRIENKIESVSITNARIPRPRVRSLSFDEKSRRAEKERD